MRKVEQHSERLRQPIEALAGGEGVAQGPWIAESEHSYRLDRWLAAMCSLTTSPHGMLQAVLHKMWCLYAQVQARECAHLWVLLSRHGGWQGDEGGMLHTPAHIEVGKDASTCHCTCAWPQVAAHPRHLHRQQY